MQQVISRQQSNIATENQTTQTYRDGTWHTQLASRHRITRDTNGRLQFESQGYNPNPMWEIQVGPNTQINFYHRQPSEEETVRDGNAVAPKYVACLVINTQQREQSQRENRGGQATRQSQQEQNDQGGQSQSVAEVVFIQDLASLFSFARDMRDLTNLISGNQNSGEQSLSNRGEQQQRGEPQREQRFSALSSGTGERVMELS